MSSRLLRSGLRLAFAFILFAPLAWVLSNEWRGQARGESTVPQQPNSCAVPSFITNRSFPSGSNNRGAAVGDVNNDGKPDIVTVNRVQPNNQISVLLGNGDGTFQSPITTTTENGVEKVTLADFNNDGKLDVAITINEQSGVVAVHLGNGNGTFGVSDIFSAGNFPDKIHTADFNNDGKMDIVFVGLVVSNSTYHFGILFGNGTGGFGSPTFYPIDAGSYGDVLPIDINQDNFIDLVSVYGRIAVPFINSGSGTFTSLIPSNTIAAQSSSNSGVNAATVGDFNGDGRREVAVGHIDNFSSVNHIGIIFRMGAANATQPFALNDWYRVWARNSRGSRPDLATADFNSDGRDDLAFIGSKTESVSVQLDTTIITNGTNSPPSNLEQRIGNNATSYYAGSNAAQILTGDFNRDGKIDLAVRADNGSSIQILLNAGGGRFNAAFRPFIDNGGAIEIEESKSDLNGDGLVDLVALGGAPSVSPFLGSVKGNFRNTALRAIDDNVPNPQSINKISLGDFDGDGKKDVVGAGINNGNSGLRFLRGNGDGTFTDSNNSTNQGVQYFGTAIGDFNSDNKLDVVATSATNIGLFRGNGQGVFFSPINFITGTDMRYIVSQDFNGDGKPDVAATDFAGNRVVVLLGNGAAGFGTPTNFAVGTNPNKLALGDFNADGKTDIVTANEGSNNVSVLLGNGMGSFGTATNFSIGAKPFWVSVGDINNDSKLDLLTANRDANSVSILLGNGDGTFTPFSITYNITQPRAVTAQDTNSDGTLDLIVANSFIENGDTLFSISVLLSSCPASPGATMQLSAITYSVSEGAARAIVTVTRTGNTSNAAAVDLTTVDGTASQRTDYTYVNATLNFAAGETTKDVVIPITNDAYQEPDETVTVTLSNPSGNAGLGATPTATLTILNDDNGTPTTNPINANPFFANQNYNDFLAREPDAAGLAYWTGELNAACGVDPACLSRRIGVSAAFFVELEFQESGAYVYRLYRAAYGNTQPFPNPDTNPPGGSVTAAQIPAYAKFLPDRARVVGGASLEDGKLEFANQFAQRAEFIARYPATQTPAQFVDAVLATVNTASGVTFNANERQNFINNVTDGGRGLMLKNLGDNAAFKQAEFNRAFVLTQYFGYLRRDPDMGGYNFWLGVINGQPQNVRGMVCAFLTATEYQQRFSSVVTRGNNLCNGMP